MIDTFYSAWIQVDRQALIHNLNMIRQQIRPAVTIRAIIKADAYGHGALPFAETLHHQGVRHFGVARLKEGIQLKIAFPDCHILLLSALLKSQYRPAIEQDLEFIIPTPVHIPLVDNLAHEIGKQARVHVKVDTGMGRVGMTLEEAGKARSLLLEAKHIDTIGLCSHLATSDEPRSAYVKQQIQLFEKARKTLNMPNITCHMANSDAIFAYPQSHYAQVRPGISLYGYGGYPDIPLKPVLSLQARITQLKEKPAGAFISYGRTYSTRGASRLAIVPAGYADGVNRLLSNQQDVLIRGQRAPIVGRITMDQTIVDVTQIPNVEEDDLVTFIGSDGQEQISAREWAQKLNTIPYEILTSMGARLERFYV